MTNHVSPFKDAQATRVALFAREQGVSFRKFALQFGRAERHLRNVWHGKAEPTRTYMAAMKATFTRLLSRDVAITELFDFDQPPPVTPAAKRGRERA